jgi:hypothetical protein
MGAGPWISRPSGNLPALKGPNVNSSQIFDPFRIGGIREPLRSTGFRPRLFIFSAFGAVAWSRPFQELHGSAPCPNLASTETLPKMDQMSGLKVAGIESIDAEDLNHQFLGKAPIFVPPPMIGLLSWRGTVESRRMGRAPNKTGRSALLGSAGALAGKSNMGKMRVRTRALPGKTP